jgi:hypothetical protein
MSDSRKLWVYALPNKMEGHGLAQDYYHRVSPAANRLAHFGHAQSISFNVYATRLSQLESQVCST